MLILAMDTSTSTGSVALVSPECVQGLLSVSIDLTHSEGLMPAIDTLLQRTGVSMKTVAAIACTTGPGSFTGLRVGIATAQGLAMANGLPCVGVSALDAFAHHACHVSLPVRPIIPARKGWIYTRLYQWNGSAMEAQSEEQYITMDDCIAMIHEPTLVFGPGFSGYQNYLEEILQEHLVHAPMIWNQPRADAIASLAMPSIQAGETLHPAQLTPHYLAPSQAEVNARPR